MNAILDFMGFPTTGKGATWGIVAFVSIAINVLDALNIFDGIGFIKSTLNKFLPSVFKEDKFRKPKTTAAANAMLA